MKISAGVCVCVCVLRHSVLFSTETVVAESVVVIKKLLQTQPTQHSEIIKHMAKLFDKITVQCAVLELETLKGCVLIG